MNALSVTLKNLRAEKGVTQEQVAEAIQVSTSLIAAFETGRLIPQPDTAKDLDEHFDCGNLIRRLSSLARQQGRQQSWFRPFGDYEREAVALRGYQPLYIPGLLQTEEYARAVLAAGVLDEEEAQEQLAARLDRQATIRDGTRPPMMTFVVDIHALRRGDPDLMKEQLVHLLDLAARPRLALHVVPDDIGLYVGQAGAFSLASQQDGSNVAYMEDQLTGRTIVDPEKVATIVQCWEGVRSVALNREQTQRLISRMVNEHEHPCARPPLAEVEPQQL